MRILLAIVGLSFSLNAVRAVENPLWELPTGFHNPQALAVDQAQPKYLYAALKEGGVAVMQLAKKGAPRELARLPKKKLAGLDAMNLWQQGDLLLVALGDFFRQGDYAGIALIDVSSPAEPRVLSVWKSEKSMHGSAVVTCDKKRRLAFLGAMDHGVLIFDIRDPKKIRLLSKFVPDIHFPKRNPNRVQHPNARGMRVDGNKLFVCYDAGGIRVLDISDPGKPREIGRYINVGMGKKQSAYNNIHLDGKIAYAAIDYAGVEVLDISNPRAIRQLAWWNPWQAETNKNTWFNSPGHTNQIVFDAKRKRVHFSAGDSELVSLDVTDPRAPKRIAGHGAVKNGQGVWGLCAVPGGDQFYLAYIRTIVPFRGTWAGIRAVSTTDRKRVRK